jgi:endo-1,4-beta-xylanase
VKKVASHVVAKLLPTARAASVGLAILLTGSTASAQTPSLKNTFKDSFRVGGALNPAQFRQEDARGATLVKAQFDAITPENVLKWERVHPQPDSYSFELPDRYVSFGEKNHMLSPAIRLSGTTRSPHGSFKARMAIPQIAKHY